MPISFDFKGDSEISRILKDPLREKPSIELAVKISEKYGVDLYPDYLLYWNELKPSEMVSFLDELLKSMIINEDFTSEVSNNLKEDFGFLGLEYDIIKLGFNKVTEENKGEALGLDSLNTKILLLNLGFSIDKIPSEKDFNNGLKKLISSFKSNLSLTSVEIINMNNKFGIRDKGGTYIGARMGRPEKAKMRKQFNSETKSHALFPTGDSGGRNKNLVDLFKKSGKIETEFRIFENEMGEESIYPYDIETKKRNKQRFFERYTFKELEEETEESVYYKKINLDINVYEKELRKILGSDLQYPKNVKGISETINKHHTAEHLSKGFLRALNNVYVNKDGTVRYDMIEMGLTHFKPKEIGTPIEKLKELGYTHDYLGNELFSEDQIIEIFPQDVILPDCPVSGEELASDFVINTGKFVDDLLVKFYNSKPFYNFKNKIDTVGHLIIGLAPHTSSGIIGRIIGYSKTQGCFSHPVWHAAQRRNLDGDENGVMLLMDALLNYSKEFLPNRRGSTMDVSLVLTTHLYLDQVDDEVHGMDIVDYYPLEFYRACKEFKSPKEVKIENIGKRVYVDDVDNKYFGYKFTHDVEDMNDTILCSSYKSVPSMKEKLDLQLELGKKIRAVNENEVGTLVIDKHFMKDIKGNLRKFGQQQFRCTNCNTKYRRPPLIGKCTNCNLPSVNFTISEGSVKKYVQHSFNIVEEFDVDPYIVEVLELTKIRLDGVFGKENEKQKDLSSFFKK